VLLDASGVCSGFGRAGGGNPTARGIGAAVEALELAAERALGGGVSPGETDSLVVIALAGTATPPFLALLEARLARLGLRGPTVIESDLLGMFCSGTALHQGYAVIGGTGAIAARIEDGRIHTVRGGSGWLLGDIGSGFWIGHQVVRGSGWLLGDIGSGFWIGHQVVRAVVASLDGLGPPTALTPLVLEATGITRTDARSLGRSEELSQLAHALYAMRPVELARFAPLAFAAVQNEAVDNEEPQDSVAHDILAAAAAGISGVLAAAIEPDVGGVVVVGGSVLAAGLARAPGIFAHRLREAAGDAEVISVVDGVVGAAVLAIRHLGRDVDSHFHRRLSAEIDRVRASPARG